MTPLWGGSFPGVKSTLTLLPTYRGRLEDPEAVVTLDGTTFSFVPGWKSTQLNVSSPSGAAGGDEIVFTGAGFDPTISNLYTCRLVAQDGTASTMDSASVTASSSTTVTCVTPVWGKIFPASNTSVELHEDKTIKTFAKLYSGLVTQEASAFILDMFPAFTLVTPSFGTAGGGTKV